MWSTLTSQSQIHCVYSKQDKIQHYVYYNGKFGNLGKKAVNEEKCVCLQSDVVMFLFF